MGGGDVVIYHAPCSSTISVFLFCFYFSLSLNWLFLCVPHRAGGPKVEAFVFLVFYVDPFRFKWYLVTWYCSRRTENLGNDCVSIFCLKVNSSNRGCERRSPRRSLC